MSKSLILIRHAKSSWEYDLPDNERPLNKRGHNDAKLVAEAFKLKGITVDKIFSSTAKRALETCKIMCNILGRDFNEVSKEETLYDFGGKRVMNFINALPDELNSVIIFGHNHAFTALANTLGDGYIDNLPTSGLVKLEFTVNSWQDVEQGIMEFVIIPKFLKV